MSRADGYECTEDDVLREFLVNNRYEFSLVTGVDSQWFDSIKKNGSYRSEHSIFAFPAREVTFDGEGSLDSYTHKYVVPGLIIWDRIFF